MVDLGVYNYIKNALAAGKTKEQIVENLTRGGMLAPADIEDAFAAVQKGTPPRPVSAAEVSAINPPSATDSSFHEQVVAAGAETGTITASRVGLVSPRAMVNRPEERSASSETFQQALAIFVWLVAIAGVVYLFWMYVVPEVLQLQAMIHSANAQYEQHLTGGLDK